MKTRDIVITNVDMKNAVDYNNNSYSDKKYGTNRMTSRTTLTKCLCINFIDNNTGEKGYFYTPSFEIVKVDGFLVHQMLFWNSPWMQQIEQEQVAHKNILHYEGSNEPSVCIESKSIIIPTVKIGDNVIIKAKDKKITFKGDICINYVKLISINN